MMDIFATPIFDATVVYDGNELFKGQGSARQWAERLGKELKIEVVTQKLGTGWALYGTLDGADCVWGILGQRLKRIN